MFSVILCVLCACVILLLRARTREARAHRLPPVCPGWLPIIGHTHYHLTDTKRLWQRMLKVTEFCIKVGGVVWMQFGFDVYYIITDPEDALTVANSCLQKHFICDFVKSWLGEGLVTGSVEIHSRHRKLIVPGHTVQVVHGFLEVFNSQAKKLTSAMEPYIGKGLFDPSFIIRSKTLETACLTTFGSGIKDKNFLENYMNAVDKMLNLGISRYQKFYLQSDFIYKLLGYQKQEDDVIKTLNKLSNEVIHVKKAAMQDGSNHKNSSTILDNPDVYHKPLLDLLLELSMNDLLTDKEVLEELNTNITAAYETTTHTIKSILVYLGTYPEVQDKMFDEISQVVGLERDVEKDDLQKLVYTKAVIKETLRLVPTAPVTPRYVDKEVKLKNYTMRANSQVIIFFHGMHRTAAWGPDADQFRPERWLDSKSLPSSVNFGAFGLGKRSCVGQVYAMAVLSTMLVHLVRQYQWKADLTKLVMKIDVTLKPVAGQEISIERRQKIKVRSPFTLKNVCFKKIVTILLEYLLCHSDNKLNIRRDFCFMMNPKPNPKK